MVWLIGRAMRQQRLLRPAPSKAAAAWLNAPPVQVVLPARNEANNIARCVEGLIAQTYPSGQLSFTVVDDDSTDGTGAIVSDLARKDARLALMVAPPLAPGWTGKCAACWTAARDADADWLCFIDADMSPEPALIASAVNAAAESGADLLSLIARQELLTFPERLMIPCALYVLAFRQNLKELQRPGSAAVTVSGQFMLVRREAYFDVGGHSGVRSCVCEDLALAQAMKRAGGRVVMADGADLIATRMYEGWGPLWLGGAKTVEAMLGGFWPTMLMIALSLALPTALVALPLLDLATGGGGIAADAALAAASLALAAAIGLHLAGAAHFRIPLWYGLVFPIGYWVGAAIAVDGLRRSRTGRIRWKGRTYA